MKLVFVHGWSVTNTDTYGELPEAIQRLADFPIELNHIHLGRYISFHDEVSMEDVARAFNQSLHDHLADDDGTIGAFSCITHSTGGPVVRAWVELFYGKDGIAHMPLKHLVMLAPANHGSALAALGKKRVGRIKAWFQGVEPGQRILDWLSLGSDGQHTLNKATLDYDSAKAGFFPFVLIGQTIDHAFYDFLNSYLVEKGSDGVIRVAGGNMNYNFIRMEQSDEVIRKQPMTYSLKLSGGVQRPKAAPLGVIPDASHSGTKIGIMNSVTTQNMQDKPVVAEIVKCLKVDNEEDYSSREQELAALTEVSQQNSSKYQMIIFEVKDDRGETIRDYDLLILAGGNYSPSKLKKGFFVDRQYNPQSGRLVYYVDATLMRQLTKIGFRVVARPTSGFSHYACAEFRSEERAVEDLLQENESHYIEVILRRRISKNTFELGGMSSKPMSFKKLKPSPQILDYPPEA
ncbi:esterase/lipase family protein [Kordiimonas aestuarii]|uniref:esterase/lipase family protein n=1 Tax=Kordiimonas aestuarii TaxID=1005925 RepID=UPI0021D2BD71|nr:alpha/beta hydrolase [Kordiimonas aestuarii]